MGPQPLRTCSDCPAPRPGRKKRCAPCQREHDRVRLAAWRASNPGKVKSQQKRHNATRYQREREKRIAAVAAWQKANPERAAAHSRAWRARNPEKHAAATARVRANTSPAVAAERTRRYQARKLEATVEKVDYAAVAERDGWVCQICGEAVDHTIRGRTSRSVSFDHKIPLSKGGLHSYDNVQLAHFGCNAAKGNRAA